MIFSAILNQMAFLFILIIVGYVLAKLKLVPDNTESVLSKLENYIFIPALVMGTFVQHFTLEKLSTAKDILLTSLIIELIVIPLSMLCVRFCAKDKYIQNIYLYGLCFFKFRIYGKRDSKLSFPRDFFGVFAFYPCIMDRYLYMGSARAADK